MKFLALILLIALTGCASTQQAVPILTPRGYLSGTNTPVEFDGVILERLPSPRIWCGLFATFQGIRYRVESVISGPIEPGEQIVYYHLLGPPVCERNEPILSKKLFQ